MLPLILTTFAASLLGSVHCAGMCGAFATIACMPGPGSADLTIDRRPVQRSLAGLGVCYNAGRLVTYTLLGALAGGLGRALDLGATAGGLGPVAASAAGALLATVGIIILLRTAGVPIPHIRPGPRWSGRLSRLHSRAIALEPRTRAVSIGLLTPLLPCGWLYAFVATAAGTGNSLTGAVTMAAFWLGTVPFMAAMTAGMRRVAGPMASRLPIASALALIVVGLATVFGRVWMPRAAASSDSSGRAGVFCNDR